MGRFEHGCERALAAAARTAKRRSRSITILALVVILPVAGDALAETTAFHPLPAFRELLSAQRAATPADVLSPSTLSRLEQAQIADVELDQTRLVATFPGHARLYAAPGRAGKLCYVYVESNGSLISCGPNLTVGLPITFMTEHGSGRPTLVTGLARDDVLSLSFSIGGVTRTVAVQHNAFWYRNPSGGWPPRSFLIHFRDGHSARYPG